MTKLERWAQLSEIVASLGVIITLLILVQEVRTNTAAIQQQSVAQYISAVNEPFLNPQVLPNLYARVKAVDGMDNPEVQAFVERYEMSVEEAVQWTRLIGMSWLLREAQFALNGPSEELARQIRLIVSAPDQELFVRTRVLRLGGPFAEYVSSILVE